MYALTAIPIWLTKMGIIFAGMNIFTAYLKTAINWTITKFEDLLKFNFSGLFFGKNYDSYSKFHFFPSIDSPFFKMWMIFLSATILAFIILIVIRLIKRIGQDNELNVKNDTGNFITNMFSTITMVFFLPFLLVTSMTVTSLGVGFYLKIV